MDKTFLRNLIKDIKGQGFAKRELGKILNAFEYKRRGVKNNETIKKSLRAYGLNVVSFGDPSSTKLDFHVTVFGPKYIDCKGSGRNDIGLCLEAYHPSVSPVYGDDICSEVLIRFNDVLTDHLPVVDRKAENVVGYVSECKLLRMKNRNRSIKSSIVQSSAIRSDYPVTGFTHHINTHGFAMVKHHSENRFFMLSAFEWLQVLYKLQ